MTDLRQAYDYNKLKLRRQIYFRDCDVTAHQHKTTLATSSHKPQTWQTRDLDRDRAHHEDARPQTQTQDGATAHEVLDAIQSPATTENVHGQDHDHPEGATKAVTRRWISRRHSSSRARTRGSATTDRTSETRGREMTATGRSDMEVLMTEIGGMIETEIVVGGMEVTRKWRTSSAAT